MTLTAFQRVLQPSIAELIEHRTEQQGDKYDEQFGRKNQSPRLFTENGCGSRWECGP
jgi:hypothetical protein